MQLIFKNEVGASFYDKEKSILFYQSNKIIINHKTELIKTLLENTINLAHEKSLVGEIVDLTGMRGNFKIILEYLVNDYYPKMKRLGMKKVAYLVFDDLISRNLAQKICFQNHIPTNSFQHLEKAIAWVTSS